MTVQVQVIGITNVLENLHRADRMMGERLERGLVKAGFFLQRESQKEVPVDTGALKNSAYTYKEGRLLRTTVYVGYTMRYAIYVHEILANRHRPPTKAKFLEEPARRHVAEIREIIADELRGEPRSIPGMLKAGSAPLPPIQPVGRMLGRLQQVIRGLLRGLRGRR